MKIRHADNTWRMDPIDRQRTLMTGNRQLRPLEVRQLGDMGDALDEYSQRARDSLSDLLQRQSVLGRIEGEHSDWIAFPSLTPMVFVEERPSAELYEAEDIAIGAHEILYEDHLQAQNIHVHAFTQTQWSQMLRLFKERVWDLSHDSRLHRVALQVLPPALRRLPLTHAQLIALPDDLPMGLSQTECPVCTDFALATESGTIVHTTPHFVAYVPFAPRTSVHLRIIHAAHSSLLSQSCGIPQLEELAALISRCCRLLHGFHPTAAFQATIGPLHVASSERSPPDHSVINLSWTHEADQDLGGSMTFRTCALEPSVLAHRLRALASQGPG